MAFLDTIKRVVSRGERRALGGAVDTVTGLGTNSDLLARADTRVTAVSRSMIDRYYAELWIARDFVNIPVDDMFVRWREFEEDQSESMREAEDVVNARERLSEALKSSRKYGTSLLVMVSREDDLASPLNLDSIREGDLSHLYVADRFNAAVALRDEDFLSPSYGQALIYQIRLGAVHIPVHASRVIRFDAGGIPNETYGLDWSPSPMIPVFKAAITDSVIASAVGTLAQQQSVVTLRIEDLDRKVAEHGLTGSGNALPSIVERIAQFKSAMSVYGVGVMDTDTTAERINVEWRSLPQVWGVLNQRVAAITGIPATRLFGQSPVGLNATGESDMRNYAITVNAMQEDLLTRPLDTLDRVLARNVGMADPPDYHFLPLVDLSEADQAAVAQVLASTWVSLVMNGISDENEARNALNDSGFFGEHLNGDIALDELPEAEPSPDDLDDARTDN